MFRAAAFIVMVSLCMRTSASAITSKNLTNEDTMPNIDLIENRELGSVLSLFKTQFKEIIQEIALQVFEYLKDILANAKVSLLKKLGRYTLSDVFHGIFDGVTDFVVEAEELDKEDLGDNTPAESSYVFEDPYLLASLFNAQ